MTLNGNSNSNSNDNDRPYPQLQAKLDELLLRWRPLFAPNEIDPSERALKTEMEAWRLANTPSLASRHYSDTLVRELEALAGGEIKFSLYDAIVRDEKTRVLTHGIRLEVELYLEQDACLVEFHVQPDKITIGVGMRAEGDVNIKFVGDDIVLPDDLPFERASIFALYKRYPDDLQFK